MENLRLGDQLVLQALRCVMVGKGGIALADVSRLFCRRRFPRTAGLSVSGLFAVLSLLTGEVHAFSEDDLFFSDLPIVASVSRLPQRVEDASASVTVIDRDMIKSSGARDLNDVFRLIPGFQTFPNTTDAARVTYHGLSDDEFSPRLQVMIDGRSLYSPLFRGGVNWATLPVTLDDIERIEVVRGSNAVSYGSNAFMGVINIITVDPALTHGTSVGVNHGNQGVRDVMVRTGGRLGSAGDFRLSYQSKDDDGLNDRFNWQDSFRSRLFTLRADFWLSHRDELKLSLGHVDAVTRRGRLETEDVFVDGRWIEVLTGKEKADNPLRDFTQSNTHFQASWRRVLDDSSDFQLRYAYTEDRGSEAHDVALGNLLIRVDAFGGLGARHELEGQHTFALAEDARVVWGAGYRLDSARSEQVLHGLGTEYRRVARVFGNLEWRPAGWITTNLGAASEYDSMAGRNFAPRVSTSFHLAPEHTVRIGASRAYRTASTLDYRGNYLVEPYATTNGAPLPTPNLYRRLYYGNENLKPEEINTIELAYLGEFRALRSSLDVRLFRERIPNRLYEVRRFISDPVLCDYPPTAGCAAPYTLTEIQRVTIRGLEYQWRWQPFDSTRVMFGQAFTRIDSTFLDSALADPSLLTLEGIYDRFRVEAQTEQSAPRRSTSLLLMQRLPWGVDFSLAGYWVDSMKWTRNTAVDFYRRFDMRLGYPFNIAGQRGELAYTAQSINGRHGEFKWEGDPDDRIVHTRHWVSLRLDF